MPCEQKRNMRKSQACPFECLFNTHNIYRGKRERAHAHNIQRGKRERAHTHTHTPYILQRERAHTHTPCILQTARTPCILQERRQCTKRSYAHIHTAIIDRKYSMQSACASPSQITAAFPLQLRRSKAHAKVRAWTYFLRSDR